VDLHWRSTAEVEISGDLWRSLEISGDSGRSLEISDDKRRQTKTNTSKDKVKSIYHYNHECLQHQQQQHHHHHKDMSLPISVNGIPLAALLSSCIDLASTKIDDCHRGCEVIRSVHCRSLLAASVFNEETHNTADPLNDQFAKMAP
jgi:hypothetical protein